MRIDVVAERRHPQDAEARALAHDDLPAIGEPLVRAMAGLPPRRGSCGVAMVRVTPLATTVQPCVYWPGGEAPLDILLDAGSEVVATEPFAEARSVPNACTGCTHLAAVRGRMRGPASPSISPGRSARHAQA